MNNLNLIGQLIAFHTDFDRKNIVLGTVTEARSRLKKNFFGFKKEITEYKITWHTIDENLSEDTWVESEGIEAGINILQASMEQKNEKSQS